MDKLLKVLIIVKDAVSAFIDPSVNKTTVQKAGTLTTVLTTLSLVLYIAIQVIGAWHNLGVTSQDDRGDILEVRDVSVEVGEVQGALEVSQDSQGHGSEVVFEGGGKSVGLQ